MPNCNYCKKDAIYAFKDFGAGCYLGSATGGKAYAEDGSLIEPIKVVYGCEDHQQNLYDLATNNAQ